MEEKTNVEIKTENQRKEKDLFFEKHPQSPISYQEKDSFNGLNYYPFKKEFIFKLKLNEHENKEKIEVDDNKGNKQEFIRWGEFRFNINDKQVILQAYKSDINEERLWVPFKDKTNETETYGAGRYIDLSLEDKENNEWNLDFNQAYNPFCAYSESYVCPFIPPENWLNVEIKAGEKKYH